MYFVCTSWPFILYICLYFPVPDAVDVAYLQVIAKVTPVYGSCSNYAITIWQRHDCRIPQRPRFGQPVWQTLIKRILLFETRYAATCWTPLLETGSLKHRTGLKRKATLLIMRQELLREIRDRLLQEEREHVERQERANALEGALRLFCCLRTAESDNVDPAEDISGLGLYVDEQVKVFGSLISQAAGDCDLEREIGKLMSAIEAEVRSGYPSVAHVCFPPDEESHGYTESNSQGGDGAPTSRFSSFLQILQTNGRQNHVQYSLRVAENRRHLCLTTLAWTLAVAGMVVAVGFLAADFHFAQTNLAIHVDRTETPKMAYPAIAVCSDVPRLPFFFHYPTKNYPGMALFGLSQFSTKNGSSGVRRLIRYPKTIPGNESPFEEVYSGSSQSACDGLEEKTSMYFAGKALFSLGDLFDATKTSKRANSSNECYSCMRVGVTEKVLHSQGSQGERGDGPTSPPYHLTFFRSKLATGCSTLSGLRDRNVRQLIAGQIRSHAVGLAARGILDFATHPPRNLEYDALLTIPFGFNHDSRLGGGDFIESMLFACNVYFYAGYFYPTAGTPDIRYRYEHNNRSWVATGSGPFFGIRTWDKNAPDLTGPGLSGVDRDLYTTSSAQILFQDPDSVGNSKFVPMTAKIANVEAGDVTFLDVDRVEERGTISYSVNVQQVGTQTQESTGFSSYYIGISYRTPYTQSVQTVATMNWPEFLTDVFEFVGLFTGVCIFTLLVAPAQSLVHHR